MPKFSIPFHKINWHTSTMNKKHHLGTVHSSQRSFNFLCWRLLISFKPNSLLISIGTSQTAFLHWWRALPEKFVHFFNVQWHFKEFSINSSVFIVSHIVFQFFDASKFVCAVCFYSTMFDWLPKVRFALLCVYIIPSISLSFLIVC